METVIVKKQNNWLQEISSSTKIINQLVIFIVIGVLPLILPKYIQVPNWNILFVNLLLALVTSIIFEILRLKSKKNTVLNNRIIKLQLITSVVLLTSFLHFFGRINGPFFVLYLLTIMESFLNRNISFSNQIIAIMIGATSFEFIWLIGVGEKGLNLITIMELGVRISSIIFMRSYGLALAQRIIIEEELRSKLEDFNQKLKNLDLRKDEFISVAAHDLRAPLTAVKGYLSMIMEGDAGKIPKKTEEFLAGALEGAEREIRLVNNMLDISRIEEGRITFVMGNVHLIDLVTEKYHEFKSTAISKDLKISLFIEKDILDLVYVDKDRIHEVVINLLSNAIKYTDEGEIKIVVGNSSSDMIKVSVRDSGRGMTEEERNKMFSKFYRAQSSAGQVLGTGLGLYITKLLIEKFNGTIGVESELGKGSEFWFELPILKN